MVLINIAALIVAIAFVVLVFALISLIKELKATSAALREFVGRVDSDIQPALRDLNKSLADLNILTAGVAGKVEDVKSFMSVVGESSRSLRTITSTLNNAAGVLANSSIWLTGAKVAGSFMLDKLTRKRG